MTAHQIRQLSDDALAHTMGDLHDVFEIQEQAQRQGYHMPKLGQYWDDLHGCLAEYARRQRKAVA